jgi:hypothetical protein
MDDVVTPACGAGRGDGSYISWHGQRREWESDKLRVAQFAGAFGVVTAAEAITIAAEKLTCGEYSNNADASRAGIPAQDLDGHHVILGEVDLPDYPGVDKGFMFCELIGDFEYACTGILGRDDIVSRIEVVALDLKHAEEATLQLLSLAGKLLAEAW